MNRANSEQLNFAIVGCGLIGRKRAAALGATVRLRYACDLDAARAASLAQLAPGCQAIGDYHAALADPAVDAVIVSTLNAALAPIALDAVRAGKHALVEKPGALDAAQLRAVYLEQEQIELSQCVIGANPNALARAYKAGCLTEEDLDDLAGKMTPEELAALIETSSRLRLEAERKQVAAEIADGLVYDPKDVDAALKIIASKPANTQADNIDRICKAMATVDPDFRLAYDLYAKKDYAKAAEIFKKMHNLKEVTYLSAARSFLLAESLRLAGIESMKDDATYKDGRQKVFAATDVYCELVDAMPDRVSIACTATMNCAEAFDRLGRGIYAMEMYDGLVKNYALMLEKPQVKVLADKLAELEKVYKDPMASVTGKMGSVAQNLTNGDSGDATRKDEVQIVSILEDLIKTAEEKANAQPPPPKPQSGKRPQAGQGQPQPQPGDGPPKPAKGSSRQQPRRSSSPAQQSIIRVGGSAGSEFSKVMEGAEGNTWSDMPPREADQIRNAASKVISEKHRQQIEEYFRAVSEAARESGESTPP